MLEVNKTSPEGKVIAHIAVKEELIGEHLVEISKLFPEFSFDWLTAVEKNYDSFLNYLTLAIKTHHKNMLSK